MYQTAVHVSCATTLLRQPSSIQPTTTKLTLLHDNLLPLHGCFLTLNLSFLLGQYEARKVLLLWQLRETLLSSVLLLSFWHLLPHTWASLSFQRLCWIKKSVQGSGWCCVYVLYSFSPFLYLGVLQVWFFSSGFVLPCGNTSFPCWFWCGAVLRSTG